jgi:hypothetical protein
MGTINWIRLCGWVGLLASLLVGTGEFLLQYTPNGGIEDVHGYLFFNDISEARLTWGHYISVLSAPLYVLGYYFLSKQLEPAGQKQSKAFFVIGAYSFIIGAVWIGQRYFIAATVHELAAGADIGVLLTSFSEHNEPFVNVLRVAMVVVSGLWIKLILSGQTTFPKWLAVFSPIVLLVSIAGLYFAKTTLGLCLFPIAMNATHFVVFSLALLTTHKVDTVLKNG